MRTPLTEFDESGAINKGYINIHDQPPDQPVAERRLVLASEFIPRPGIDTHNSREETTGNSMGWGRRAVNRVALVGK